MGLTNFLMVSWATTLTSTVRTFPSSLDREGRCDLCQWPLVAGDLFVFQEHQRRTQDFVLGEAQRKFYSHKSTRPSMYMYVCNFGLYVCIICMDGSSHGGA